MISDFFPQEKLGFLRRLPNPPNPWHSSYIEWLGTPPPEKLEVYEEVARSILSENQSPDVAFRYSVNPYRGCHHGCIYCYARPTHEYLDFGAGGDFSRKIVVKVNAPELLRREIRCLAPQKDTLVFSGVTDPYQPLEASYRLTQACLKVAGEYGVKVAIITKGTLIRRDRDLLQEIHRVSGCQVFISLPFLSPEYARVFEPSAPLPGERLNTMESLADVGIPVGVAIAPIIPGFNDVEIPRILATARKRGARRAFMTLLRLPGSVRTIFLNQLKNFFPLRYERTIAQLKRMREGRIYTGEYFKRMGGNDESWKALEQLFDLLCRRLGYEEEARDRDSEPFLPKANPIQLSLEL